MKKTQTTKTRMLITRMMRTAALLAGAPHWHAVAQTALAIGSTAGNVSAQPSQAPACSPSEYAHMRSQLDDWAALQRYRADNASLPPPAPGVPRIVFYGDSITGFWGRGFLRNVSHKLLHTGYPSPEPFHALPRDPFTTSEWLATMANRVSMF